jgi:hypothetical protein
MNRVRSILSALFVFCGHLSAEILYVSNHDSGFISTHDPVTGAVLNAQFISTPGQPQMPLLR